MNYLASRRSFLKSTGLVALGSGFSHGLLAEDSKSVSCCSKSTGIQLGLASYTTRKLSLAETIEVCQILNLKHLSLKDVFHLPVGESAEALTEKCSTIKAAGLDLYGGGVHYMRSREDVDRTFAYAKVTHLGTLVSVVPHDLLDYTNRKIRETGIRVAIHNHGPKDELYPTPESAYERIQDLDPRFGLCIDIGHTQRSGICPAKDIIRFKDRVLDVHLKDVTEATEAGKTTQMGRGVIDVPAVLKAMLTIHYQGIASFEYEKDPDNPVPGLAESVGYVRGVLKMLS